MSNRITLLVLAAVFAMSGCSTMAGANKPVDADAVDPAKKTLKEGEKRKAPAIITSLPPEVESFSYQGYRFLEEKSDSYAIRYANRRKHRMADVFVYEVSEGNRNLEHAQLVMGSTRATLRGLADAVKQGLYSNFNVLGGVLYQTEYNGTLIKVRVSMPDNETNRANREWDRTAEVLIDNIITHIESTGKADTANSKKKKLPIIKPSEA